MAHSESDQDADATPTDAPTIPIDDLRALFPSHDIVVTDINHNVTGTLTGWDVLCTDCGKAVEVDDATDRDYTDRDYKVNHGDLRDRDCATPTLDIDTDHDHDLIIGDETKAGPIYSDTRPITCTECGRTAVDRDAERLANRPCQETYTSNELMAAVRWTTLSDSPNPRALGLSGWAFNSNSDNGWGRDIDYYWTHPDVPYTLVGRQQHGHLSVDVVEGNKPLRRAPTVQSLDVSGDVDGGDPEAFEQVVAFMQATDDMSAEQWTRLADHVDDIVTHVIEHHDVDRRVRF